MPMEDMDKMGGNKGSNEVSSREAFTQNLSEEPVSMERLRKANPSMNVPGQGNVAKAAGAVKEGSARKYANAMDAITGPVDEPVRSASSGDN
jgi:hypothetical protein